MSSSHPPSLSPTRLNVATFAQAGDVLSGEDPLAIYERLAHDLHGQTANYADKYVVWRAVGHTHTPAGGPPQHWMHMLVQASLPMTCQRCLQAADMEVEIDLQYRFVADEATALAQDEESEEDLLVISKQFNLQELIEDELLMALPIVPKHEVCPGDLKLSSSDDDFKAALTQKPNAFAALGSLKKLS
jgi:uncharacterized protein